MKNNRSKEEDFFFNIMKLMKEQFSHCVLKIVSEININSNK